MSGYRQHSYDPNAYEQPGPPLRPFNWVQWTGVGMGSIGVALATLHLAGRIGWIPQWVDDPTPAAIILPLLGVTLVNSRRAPSIEIGPEQRAKNQRTLLITIAICAAVIGFAAAIEFTGA